MSPEIEFKMLHSDKFLLDIDNSNSESDNDISDNEISVASDTVSYRN